MPKNQFQRPMPVRHDTKVPRHGKPQPPVGKTGKPAKPVPALPPLAALLDKSPSK